MLNGINHITVAVKDLDTSFDFYVDLLGMTPKARWDRGAYLQLGTLWFCLSLDESMPSKDYSHIAFDITLQNFSTYSAKLLSLGVKIWKKNKSEGDSLYILDPDNHKLEIHAGNLVDRLNSLKLTPYNGLQLF